MQIVPLADQQHPIRDAGTLDLRFDLGLDRASAGNEILFLRRMEPGAASRSYGIEVARHAGFPPSVIKRAREVLSNLEGGEFDERGKPRLAAESSSGAPTQLALPGLGVAPPTDPLREALAGLEPDELTPIEALLELARLKQLWLGEK